MGSPTQFGGHEPSKNIMNSSNSSPTLHGGHVEVTKKPDGKPQGDGRAIRRKLQKDMMRAQLSKVGGSTLTDAPSIKFQNEATMLRNETTLLAMQSVADDRTARRTPQKDMLRAELGKLS